MVYKEVGLWHCDIENSGVNEVQLICKEALANDANSWYFFWKSYVAFACPLTNHVSQETGLQCSRNVLSYLDLNFLLIIVVLNVVLVDCFFSSELRIADV